MKIVRILAGLLIAVLVILQFVPVERSNPPSSMEIPAPEKIKSILERSCFDCHSNSTRWPWYSRIAPVSWLISGHVKEARQEFNLSTWDRYDVKKQAHILEKMAEEVREGKMPLKSYELLHPKSKLEDEEKKRLLEWADEQINELFY